VVGISLPDEDRLPTGPARDLVIALHELYRGAGRPGLRRIANAVRSGDFTDVVSHEAISDMLNGESVPRWSKLDCVVRQLAAWNVPPHDPSATAVRFLPLWEVATGGITASIARPAPVNPGTKSPVGRDADGRGTSPPEQRPTAPGWQPDEVLRPIADMGEAVPSGNPSSSDQAVFEWPQSRHALITGQPRWREPDNDRQTAQLRALRDNQSSHPVISTRSALPVRPPAVRVSVCIACNPMPAREPTSSVVRNSFLDFLSRQPVAGLVGELAPLEREWEKWGGHGRANHEAIVTGIGQDTEPLGWARLLLPEPRMPAGWRDPHSALFLLHIEPQGRNNTAPSRELLHWLIPFRKALEIPSALAQFLTEDLGLEIPRKNPDIMDDFFSDDPTGSPAAVGLAAVWLTTPQAITDLVDITGYHQLPGSPASPQFEGYAIIHAEGSDTTEMAIEMMRQMCDYALHLDDSDSALSALAQQINR
jgi:hypothetical protein